VAACSLPECRQFLIDNNLIGAKTGPVRKIVLISLITFARDGGEEKRELFTVADFIARRREMFERLPKADKEIILNGVPREVTGADTMLVALFPGRGGTWRYMTSMMWTMKHG
jgi:hypothetical protein